MKISVLSNGRNRVGLKEIIEKEKKRRREDYKKKIMRYESIIKEENKLNELIELIGNLFITYYFVVSAFFRQRTSLTPKTQPN